MKPSAQAIGILLSKASLRVTKIEGDRYHVEALDSIVLTIESSELAQAAGLSTDGPRHYEKLVIVAKPPMTPGGYRKALTNVVRYYTQT